MVKRGKWRFLKWRRWLWVMLLLLGVEHLVGCDKEGDFFAISAIEVVGQKKTRTSIIERELGFNIGDRVHYADVETLMSKAENQLINTHLFLEVSVFADTSRCMVYVMLQEDWYLIPVPRLQLADRNFNQWWLDRDVSRLEYGLNIRWKNVSGRNDILDVDVRGGYTHQFYGSYTRPFIGKNRHWGFVMGLGVNANREVWLKPLDDKLQFYVGEDAPFLIRRRMAYAGLTYRKGLYDKQLVQLTAHRSRVDSQLLMDEQNPFFMMNMSTKLRVLGIQYMAIYDRRDIRGYAFNGYFLKGIVQLESFVNPGYKPEYNPRIQMFAQGFKAYRKKWLFNAGFSGQLSGLNRPPYEFFRALGYGNQFVRGYEYYVIDGKDYGLMRTNLKYALLYKKKYLLQDVPRAFREATVTVAGGLFVDAGYVHSPFVYEGNRLPNQWLRSIGIGLDWVMYYDRVFRFEYALNGLGERGFYVHFYSPL